MSDAAASSGLIWLDYLAVVAYLGVTAGIVARASRKQSDSEDFFLGGRSMPWLAVGLSIMATLLSTNTYLGAPGEMIKYGPAYFIGYMTFPLLAVIILFLWIPFFMRLRLTSAYEYLEKRYDGRCRLLGGLLFLGLRLGWMSMVVYTASRAMVTMVPGPLTAIADFLGVPHPIYPVIAAVGIVATVFACLGGIRAVIWTDVLQAAMLFGGVIVIIAYVAWAEGTGPAVWWNEIVSESTGTPQVIWFSTDITERTTVLWAVLSVMAWQVCTHCSDQVALQRYFATTSLSAARKSFLVNLLSAATINILLAISGLALRYFYLRHSERLPDDLTPTSGADQLMPYFYAFQLPAGFGGLILVSFLCDAMQTLSSGVNSIAAVVTSEAAARRSGSDDVRSARLVTLGVGLISSLLAVFAAAYAMQAGKTIFDMLPRMFNMFLGPLAAMFMVGMFFPRTTAPVMLTSTLITQAFSSAWSWWGEIPWLLQKLGLSGFADTWINVLGVDAEGKAKTPSVLLAIALPAIVGVLLGGSLSFLFGRKDHSGTEYTWRAIMRRNEIHH